MRVEGHTETPLLLSLYNQRFRSPLAIQDVRKLAVCDHSSLDFERLSLNLLFSRTCSLCINFEPGSLLGLWLSIADKPGLWLLLCRALIRVVQKELDVVIDRRLFQGMLLQRDSRPFERLRFQCHL